MKAKFFLSVSAMAASAVISTAAQATQVCHIANAGFLIKGENTSVLIDALMIEDQYEGRFALPSEPLQKQMMERTGIFDGLSVVAATHMHGDHFDPKATIAHLRKNLDIAYVLPADTHATLNANGLTENEQQRITFVPDGQQVQYSFGDVTIEAFDVDHGPNMPQNTGYRITVDGVSVFHTGDINATRAQLSDSGLNSLAVDALMIPFWYGLGDQTQLDAMNQSWAHKLVIPTHFGTKPAPWMDQFGGFEKLPETVASKFDNAHIVANEGECYSIK